MFNFNTFLILNIFKYFINYKMSKSNIMVKMFAYAFFCAVMAVFISAWAMGTAMNVKQNRDSASFQLIFIFGVFVYVSYLFWGKNVIFILLPLALYGIYNRFFRNKYEAKYII